MRRREVRCLKATELLDALARYSEWGRRKAGWRSSSQGGTQDVTDAALQELGRGPAAMVSGAVPRGRTGLRHPPAADRLSAQPADAAHAGP
jgi:hypothetical protein